MKKARHDRLLTALIARLPEGNIPWTQDDRIAWLWMMTLAFDVVYGPCGGISIVPERAPKGRPDAIASAAAQSCPANADDGRFYVDRDGFAMADGLPITIGDLPAGTILWDERAGIECGDPATILWRDVGTTRRSLPPGVTLKPATDAD
jgi:hypothetical protein